MKKRPELPPCKFCGECGRMLPRLLKQPIPDDYELRWGSMMNIERQLLAGVMLANVFNPYKVWSPLEAAQWSQRRYRTTQNALRRLVPCKWVERVARGRYCLTVLAVTTMRDMITGPRMTVRSLVHAQEPAQGVKVL